MDRWLAGWRAFKKLYNRYRSRFESKWSTRIVFWDFFVPPPPPPSHRARIASWRWARNFILLLLFRIWAIGFFLFLDFENNISRLARGYVVMWIDSGFQLRPIWLIKKIGFFVLFVCCVPLCVRGCVRLWPNGCAAVCIVWQKVDPKCGTPIDHLCAADADLNSSLLLMFSRITQLIDKRSGVGNIPSFKSTGLGWLGQ